ncbi:ATP-dependent DNA helicase Rep [Thioalkalivibrio nitratireducens DSM 14787]|uniref:ATP-dependent DNA helicase Rep n=1 Tax=Thioalkalivibrio nitratireducens (strain DSM 14787 / UNIQEM 213 / ALEN2) TaxID=1255043 RepID=L0DT46_THIND|nr:UvrD-helicase domain-containing protein [Thioalkalivibrio nitratireducens]AGA32167.1 ATP-dependent DNA helicase Rep [Thioalkalivibrio nitratireducens DSM 14787]
MLELNPQQRAAITTADRPTLVLAGAGSGKTRVITEKIAYLIERRGLPARSIVAITFTNKAAREMLERVRGRLDREQGRGLTVSTFHTFGLNFLRRELDAAGLRTGFSVLDPGDCRQLLREITHRDNDPGVPEALLARISAWKNALVDPEQAESHAADPEEQLAARVYRRYQQALSAYNAVDFDDLILGPVATLAADATLRERWQNRIRHLLVDEYQDTNGAQYRLVQLLVGVSPGLTVVGDDDQSIYAWRGARPENLARLQQDFARLEVIKLEQNYRSTNRILAAANQLIGHNPHLYEKRLWSALGEGEPIRVIACSDAEAETARVVSELMRQRFRLRARWADFAILYRSNHQSRPFEKLLREQAIPYRISGGQSFFERSEIRDLAAYLRLLVNPDDNPAFLRVVNVPRREIGPATLEKLGHHAHQRGCSLLRAAGGIGLGEHLDSRGQLRLSRFSDWVGEMRTLAESNTPDGLLRRVVDETDYEAWLMDTSPNPRAASRRMDQVREFIDWVGRVARPGTPDGDTLGLDDVVARISLMDILERQREEQDQDAVQLLTLHTAKGLEFPHVFLVGFEEELLPHRVSLEEDNLEEERRLAYVGLTRARETLTLTYAARRARYGEAIDCVPSRFLDELPADHLEWPDAKPPDPETQRMTAKAHLAGLKAMLRG